MAGTLRLTAHAEADALLQSAAAEVRHDKTGAARARSLAEWLSAGRQRLEAGHARYEQWAAATHPIREAAGKAQAELQRRGQAQPDDEPRTTAGRWHEFETDSEAVEGAIARQHQAATGGEAWPPQRAPEPAPDTNPEAASASVQAWQDDRAARLDQLLALAGDTAQRLTVQRAERQASSEYAARLERQAQAEPEAAHQAEGREGFEIEM